METLRSKEGTTIAYQKSGTGPSLILVRGMLGSSCRWPVLPALETQFAVYAIERRGRNESGDAGGYAIEHEFDDVAAFVNLIDDDVNAGDQEKLVMTFLREVVEMPADGLELLKASPVFPSMVAAAHTVPRELQAEVGYRF